MRIKIDTMTTLFILYSSNTGYHVVSRFPIPILLDPYCRDRSHSGIFKIWGIPLFRSQEIRVFLLSTYETLNPGYDILLFICVNKTNFLFPSDLNYMDRVKEKRRGFLFPVSVFLLDLQ